jgi:hypothetical protein
MLEQNFRNALMPKPRSPQTWTEMLEKRFPKQGDIIKQKLMHAQTSSRTLLAAVDFSVMTLLKRAHHKDPQ